MNGKRVLVVDDSPTQAAALLALLGREGYAASHADDAPGAVRQISGAQPPDAVVMGVAPADASWTETLRAMKTRAHPRFLPVVVLSSEASLEARVSGLRAGADDVIGRPCASSELLARLEAMLRIRSAQDALAFEKAELEQLSIKDPLTGLFNRRYFQYRMQQEFERTRRHGDPVSLLVLDLDHFKRLNDRYGHRAGDEALRATAELLTRAVRRLDVCTRWGGEEFAVIMPGTGEAGAMVVARRVLQALRSTECLLAPPIDDPAASAELVRVTASIGVATYPTSTAASVEQLVHLADAAVYRAKHSGRDQICLASESRDGATEPIRLVHPAPAVAMAR